MQGSILSQTTRTDKFGESSQTIQKQLGSITGTRNLLINLPFFQ